MDKKLKGIQCEYDNKNLNKEPNVNDKNPILDKGKNPALKIPIFIKETLTLKNFYSFKNDIIGFIQNKTYQFPPLVKIGFPFNSVYASSDAELAHAILVEELYKTTKGQFSDFLKKVTGNSILVAEGDYWSRNRKIIQPSFNSVHIKNYFNIMLNETMSKAKEWEDNQINQIITQTEMDKLTIKIIAKSILDTEIHELDSQIHYKFISLLNYINHHFLSFVHFPLWVPTIRNLHFKKMTFSIRQTLLEIIFERQKKIIEKKVLPEQLCMLDYLILNSESNNANKLSNSQICDELITMIVAGFKTTASALTICWYKLAQSENYTQQIINEINEIVGGDELNFSHLKKLKFTRKFILEVLRMYPPIYYVVREMKKNYNDIYNWKIDPKKMILISIYGIHHNPLYWSEPEVFNPERFENETEIKFQHIFLPFSLGQRNCLGNEFALIEMLTVICTLIRKYKFNLLENYTLKIANNFILKITDKLPLKISRHLKYHLSIIFSPMIYVLITYYL